MSQQRITWIGASLGNYVVESLLGEGMYSWVYSCLGPNNEQRAVKASKPEDHIGSVPSVTKAFPTQALLQVTGSLVEVKPDTDELLAFQIEKLQAIKTAGMPKVLESVVQSGLSYYFMDIAPGSNLREIMKDGPIRTGAVVAIAETMVALQKDPAFAFHGDLKPDNIMVHGDEVLILDPGYFGPIGTMYGAETNVSITTPMYYPELAPDDDRAFGIMLWELAAGKHPLTGRHAAEFDPMRHGEKLELYVRGLQSVGKGRFIKGLLALDVPSIRNAQVDRELERLLLSSIGLALTPDKKLERAEKRATIANVLPYLQKMQRQGKEVFTLHDQGSP